MIPSRLNTSAPNSSSATRRQRVQSGMTMIELVAALALFVIIMGALMTVMDTATSLWSTSRGQQRESTLTQNIVDMIADDLQQAVTDNGNVTNSMATSKPSFIVDARTDTVLDPATPSILLQFIRNASRRQLSDTGNPPLSLVAVFYSYYENGLYRHVVPLSYTSFDQPESLGELLEKARNDNAIGGIDRHDKIKRAFTEGSAAPTEAPQGASLLAERVDTAGVFVAIPKAFVPPLTPSHLVTDEVQISDGPTKPAEYDQLGTTVLPDRIDFYLELFNEEHWNEFQSAIKRNDLVAAQRVKDHFGIRISKRISLPTHGGSRLP